MKEQLSIAAFGHQILSAIGMAGDACKREATLATSLRAVATVLRFAIIWSSQVR